MPVSHGQLPPAAIEVAESSITRATIISTDIARILDTDSVLDCCVSSLGKLIYLMCVDDVSGITESPAVWLNVLCGYVG